MRRVDIFKLRHGLIIGDIALVRYDGKVYYGHKDSALVPQDSNEFKFRIEGKAEVLVRNARRSTYVFVWHDSDRSSLDEAVEIKGIPALRVITHGSNLIDRMICDFRAAIKFDDDRIDRFYIVDFDDSSITYKYLAEDGEIYEAPLILLKGKAFRRDDGNVIAVRVSFGGEELWAVKRWAEYTPTFLDASVNEILELYEKEEIEKMSYCRD